MADAATPTNVPAAALCQVGHRPKPWVATIDDKALCDRRGAIRRFSTEFAALEAAQLEAFLREIDAGEA